MKSNTQPACHLGKFTEPAAGLNPQTRDPRKLGLELALRLLGPDLGDEQLSREAHLVRSRAVRNRPPRGPISVGGLSVSQRPATSPLRQRECADLGHATTRPTRCGCGARI